MAYGTINADVIGTSVAGSNLGAGNATQFKNRIINGAMVIDQRNAGASVTPTNGQYALDRWECRLSVASKYSVQRSTDAPIGFTNSMLCTSLSAYSVGASETFYINQKIEGFNIADLGWGTANAKTVTLSFWVKSSLTGTFGGVVRNASGTQATYPFAYTISSANTWEQKSVTVAGDTTGTWPTDNSTGIRVAFSLGTGSTLSGTAGAWNANNNFSASGATSVVGTNGATFYITGVQLEVGESATGFDYRPYGTELALCQRYYYRQKATVALSDFGLGLAQTSTIATVFTSFPVAMRTAPTALEQTGTASNYQVLYQTSTAVCSAVPSFAIADTWGARTSATVASGLTAGHAVYLRNNNTTDAYLAWSAEL